MIKTNEILLKNNNHWLHFTDPYKVISTNFVDNLYESLREVENLVEKNNWHAAGIVSYESAPAFDKALQVVHSHDFPLLWFGLYPKPQMLASLPAATRSFKAHTWLPETPREEYNTSIEKIKDYIAKGQTYQVNYTTRLATDFTEDPWEFFLHFSQNQNKYAAFVNLGRYAICSASPELFFQLDGEKIVSQPMKGTIERGRTTTEDGEKAEQLKKSEKNRAENVMIVDMVRNDLGRIAEAGSVHVPELFNIEKYPTLFQMTSTVEAKTKASITEIFTALFPCASITGAPKISTMKIISELENTPRKIYTGSIGFISPGRKAQFNVAIRTAIVDEEGNSAEYGIGSGIVWDSNIADEYDETMLKSRVITNPPLEFSLLETLHWTPQEGYFLLEKHLARMADSADYFDFIFSRAKLEEFLHTLAKNFTTSQRVRILSNRIGESTVEANEFPPQEKVFTAQLADQPIDSRNAFFFHKTTLRKIYPIPTLFDDVLLYNENDELTEFTIGNLVVKIKGKLFTPPISCGLLAGTFRAHLLETDQVQERVVHTKQLHLFEEIYLVNSVRKWVRIKINNAGN